MSSRMGESRAAALTDRRLRDRQVPPAHRVGHPCAQQPISYYVGDVHTWTQSWTHCADLRNTSGAPRWVLTHRGASIRGVPRSGQNGATTDASRHGTQTSPMIGPGRLYEAASSLFGCTIC